jgi:hypothetical protein
MQIDVEHQNEPARVCAASTVRAGYAREKGHPQPRMKSHRLVEGMISCTAQFRNSANEK